MRNRISGLFQSILNSPGIIHIRRNHALEHATLHLLSIRFPGVPLAGHSTVSGFRLIGDVPTDAVQQVINEAASRMKAGEHRLAIHPNCGTNFITGGTIAGLAGAAAMLGSGNRRRDKLERLPLAISLATLAIVASQPLGSLLQAKVTTSGDLGDLEVERIVRFQHGQLTIHRVYTRG